MMGETPRADAPGPAEVRTFIPIPLASSRAWGIGLLVVVTLVAVVAVIAWPSIALRFVLPMAAFLATVGVRVVCFRPSPVAILFDARGIGVETPGFEGRTVWADVTRIVDSPAALVIEVVQATPYRIPWSAKPDLRAILALAPKSVVFQSRSATPSGRRHWALWAALIWILFLVIPMAIYSLTAQESVP